MKIGKLFEEVSNEVQFVTKEDEDRYKISAVRGGKWLGTIVLEFIVNGYWEFEDELSEEQYYELFPDDRFVSVENLMVQRQYRGEGVAKILMNRAINFVKREGWDVMFLNANPTDGSGLDIDGLVGFYGKFGFKIPPYLGNWDENKEMILRL